jgi:3-oxoacyl-[acyl-carrier-protein] synthase II
MSDREVVITGMGLVTPLGRNVEENWDNVKAMKTGINCYPEEELPEFLHYYGKVEEFKITEDIPPKLVNQMKFLNRGSLLGFGSAHEAISTSGMDISNVPPHRRALYIASGDMTKLDHEFMYPATKDGTNGKWDKIDFEKLNQIK